jgi:hypothetical protein
MMSRLLLDDFSRHPAFTYKVSFLLYLRQAQDAEGFSPNDDSSNAHRAI